MRSPAILALYLSMTAATFAALSCGRTDLEFSGPPDGGGNLGGGDGGVDAAGGRGVAGGPGSGGAVSATGGRAGSGGAVSATGGRAGSGGAVSATGGRAGTGGRTGSGGRAATGGTTGVPDAGVRDGAAGDGPGPDLPPSMPGRLSCGSQTCDTSTQSCCIGVASGTLAARCVPLGTACAGATLACDEPADCAAGVCCFGLQAGMGISIGSACTTRAACGGIGRFVVCRANSDCGPATPVCCPSAGARVCRASCAGN